jgi:hypothetical protein
MLDYAANATSYWTEEGMRREFEATCAARQTDPDEVLHSFLGGADPDSFWQGAKTNLQAGRVRLLFVADAIPQELKRVIEFLNSQMETAEVLGVEIARFEGKGVVTLVPQVTGRTAQAEARNKAGARAPRQWDKVTFLRAIEDNKGSVALSTAKEIMNWCADKPLRLAWGTGAKSGSFSPVLDHHGQSYWPVALWTYGQVEFQFQYMKTRPPFDDLELRQEWLGRVNAIPDISLPASGVERRPSFPITLLTDRKRLEQFLASMEWFYETSKA